MEKSENKDIQSQEEIKQEYIYLTKQTLKKLHKTYNKLYFEGKLHRADFGYLYDFNDKDTYGVYIGRRSRKDKTPLIKINHDNKWTEESLRFTLIHEMIHQYIYECMGGCLIPHGRKFKKVCKIFKEKYGIIIEKYFPKKYIIK